MKLTPPADTAIDAEVDLNLGDNGYFKPGRDDLRRVLREKMPRMFSVGSAASPEADVVKRTLIDRLKAMTDENWTTIRDELIAEINGQTTTGGSDMLLLK